MSSIKEGVLLLVQVLDALARIMTSWLGLFLAFGGGLIWWRHDIIRRKRVDASLGVLEALDRVREAFHAARRQDIPSSAVAGRQNKAKWREEQMLTLEAECRSVVAKLHAARDALLDAQAKAVALWGETAKEPFQLIYRYVDLLTMDSKRYWPDAIRVARVQDARWDEPNLEIKFPQPPQMLYGHPGDDYGRKFDEAIRTAEQWYEGHAGRKKRRR